MAQRNKYGLSRTVPAAIKRKIRRRCGFGCVVCGLAYYEYEHFNPDFAEARRHDPDGMTLLCSQCNQKRARKRMSAQTVADANQNPKCLQNGFAHEVFHFHEEPLEIIIGVTEFVNCPDLIVVNGCPILSMRPPEEDGQPFLLSGVFADSRGRISLKIKDNEFQVISGNWDVEMVAGNIKIKDESGLVCLSMTLNPPSGLTIDRLEMYFQGVRFSGVAEEFKVSTNGEYWTHIQAAAIRNSPVGIMINKGIGPVASNDAIF